MYLQYNKFLRKYANTAPTPPKQPGFWDSVGESWDNFMVGKDLFGWTSPKAAYDFKTAGDRLKAYQNGTAAKDYDPIPDMRYTGQVMSTPEFQKNYGAWSSDPANKKHRRYNDLANIYAKRDAFNYAAKNPEHFKQALNYKGLGLTDFLFGSTQDNYNVLRLSKSPLRGLMNTDQLAQIDKNYWLMNMIWRVKKFFSEFGNWKDVKDPADFN